MQCVFSVIQHLKYGLDLISVKLNLGYRDNSNGHVETLLPAFLVAQKMASAAVLGRSKKPGIPEENMKSTTKARLVC